MTKVHRPTIFDKYTVFLSDLTAIGAATSGNVKLDSLPPNSIVTLTLVKPSTALVGPSLTAATARVTSNSKNFGTAYDVFQAVGDTVLDFDGTHAQFVSVAAQDLNLAIVLTGANASVLTAGQIDVYVEYVML